MIAEGQDAQWVERFKKNPLGEARTPRELAMIRHAIQLTLAPGTVGRADVDRLRAHGLRDEDVLDLTQVIAFFNYINRIADGLGVPDEPEWSGDH